MNPIKIRLTRPAKAKGGDRYEASLLGEEKPWVVYLPQAISRRQGIPTNELFVVIASIEENKETKK